MRRRRCISRRTSGRASTLFLDPSRTLPPQALLRLASHLVRGEYCAAPPALRLNGLLSLFERAARYSRDIAEI